MHASVPLTSLCIACALGLVVWRLARDVRAWSVRPTAAGFPPRGATLTQCLDYPDWVSAVLQLIPTPRQEFVDRVGDRLALMRAQAYVDQCRSFHERLRATTEWFADGLGSHVLFREFDLPNRGRVEALLFVTGLLDKIMEGDLSHLPLATTDLPETGCKGIYAWTGESASVVAAAAAFCSGSDHAMQIDSLLSEAAYASLRRDYDATVHCVLRPGKGQVRARMQQHRAEIRRHADGRRSDSVTPGGQASTGSTTCLQPRSASARVMTRPAFNMTRGIQRTPCNVHPPTSAC
jgi:hypothetical protein